LQKKLQKLFFARIEKHKFRKKSNRQTAKFSTPYRGFGFGIGFHKKKYFFFAKNADFRKKRQFSQKTPIFAKTPIFSKTLIYAKRQF
jgi:hypothetical protein